VKIQRISFDEATEKVNHAKPSFSIVKFTNIPVREWVLISYKNKLSWKPLKTPGQVDNTMEVPYIVE